MRVNCSIFFLEFNIKNQITNVKVFFQFKRTNDVQLYQNYVPDFHYDLYDKRKKATFAKLNQYIKYYPASDRNFET